MSYPSYPSYPNYPSHPSYPSYPNQPNNPSYPNYPTSNPSYPSNYPANPASVYPVYPVTSVQHPQPVGNYDQIGGYPITPNQRPAGWVADSNYPNTSYPPPTVPGSYPLAPQPSHIPSAPSYPLFNPNSCQQYNPNTGNISLAPSTSGPLASSNGIYPLLPSQGVQAPRQQIPSIPSVQNVPTVYPASPFDPRADAEVLHRAMKGFGTDERSLIAVLCHRTREQRVLISQAYKSGYGKDLESKLKSELSGCLERVLVALSLPVAVFMAREVHDAISGLGTNDQTLIEILCSSTNQEIRELNQAYLNLYKRPMERDLQGDTSGDFRNLLVSLAQGHRDEFQTVDYQNAKSDAHRLFRAGEGRIGTDESTFNAILATRSWSYLRQIMAEYQAISGHSLERAVAKEFSFNAEKGLITILQCAENRPAYFARRLHTALKGLGTNDRCLIRILVTRSDVDLENIKVEYSKAFGRSLQSDVAGDTSGDYKKALLALLN